MFDSALVLATHVHESDALLKDIKQTRGTPRPSSNKKEELMFLDMYLGSTVGASCPSSSQLTLRIRH